MSGKPSKSDAVELLTADHRAIEALFDRFDALCLRDAAHAEKRQVADAICVALSVHAQIEEEFFYPAMRSASNDAAMIDEVEVEHLMAKDLIAQISSMQPADALYDARLVVLRKTNDHHVRREESALFARARRGAIDLVALGAAMRERKALLLREYTGMSQGHVRFDAAGDLIGRSTLKRGAQLPRMRGADRARAQVWA